MQEMNLERRDGPLGAMDIPDKAVYRWRDLSTSGGRLIIYRTYTIIILIVMAC